MVFNKLGGTFYHTYVSNVETVRLTMAFIQFTTKDMWYVPKVKANKYDGWTAGWLFFYFGTLETK